MSEPLPERELAAINLHSASYDRVTNALSLAIICLTLDMNVSILVTYDALRRFVKGHLEDMDNTDESYQSMFRNGIAAGKITPITEKLVEAKKLGLKLYACPNAMMNMNILAEDLVPEVDDLMGLVVFVNLARTAKINWYI